MSAPVIYCRADCEDGLCKGCLPPGATIPEMYPVKPENPQAFPLVSEGGENSRLHPELHHGMSLRDYFAGRALPTVIVLAADHGLSPTEVASDAYKLADAMLAARGPK